MLEPPASGPPPLPSALLRRDAFPHAVADAPTLVETHISWVVLTGPFAYKLKKPVRFSFLDFSTLERRRLACEEELRLNRRMAPDLYLDVVPIRWSGHDLAVGGDRGTIVEWAVRMKQFPSQDQLDHCIGQGRLDPGELEDFGGSLSRFHRQLPAAPAGSPHGSPDTVQRGILENLDEARLDARDGRERQALDRLRNWFVDRFEALRPTLAQRKADGWIREGHGDLHLGNLVRWQGRIVAFDCIEFDPALRWGDVLSDAAFLYMDLLRRGRPDLAYRFLDAYLQDGGDYGGVLLLAHYAVHRALVRAKVHMISRRRDRADAHAQAVAGHLALAAQLAGSKTRPLLVVMHGLSGSGKSWLSARLLAHLPAIRMRSDVERKRLHGLAAAARTSSGLDQGLYAAGESDRTYARLETLAEAVLRGGQNAIVDGTFLLAAQRLRMRELAARTGARHVLLDCQAPVAILRQRIAQRSSQADASEADLQVLDRQLSKAEPMQEAERRQWLSMDTTTPCDIDALVRRLRAEGAPAQ